MEKINQNSELKKGSMILIIPTDNKENRFEDVMKARYGVLRDDYSNTTSLSGVLSKIITIFRISGIVKEINADRVFCWYKDSFILLGGIDGGDYGTNATIEIFKLNEQEALNLTNFIDKLNIVNTLEKQ